METLNVVDLNVTHIGSNVYLVRSQYNSVYLKTSLEEIKKIAEQNSEFVREEKYSNKVVYYCYSKLNEYHLMRKLGIEEYIQTF